MLVVLHHGVASCVRFSAESVDHAEGVVRPPFCAELAEHDDAVPPYSAAYANITGC